MKARFMTSISIAMIAVLGASCATPSGPLPARLGKTDEATMGRVRAVLAQALGRTRIEMGPENLAVSTSLSVLPLPLGPYDTRSPATPAIFDIVIEQGACKLVARDSGRAYALGDGVCVRADR
jgi:hypothetical protein